MLVIMQNNNFMRKLFNLKDFWGVDKLMKSKMARLFNYHKVPIVSQSSTNHCTSIIEVANMLDGHLDPEHSG